MKTKQDIIRYLVGAATSPKKEEAKSFAPANIALIKYWGKRDSELNLPVTSSLSLALRHGTHTKIQLSSKDSCLLNGKECPPNFMKRLFSFIDLFRAPDTFFHIETTNEIPTGAGFASSSSGFSALVLCLNELYDWQLDKKSLSILARLGSGSASRSLYTGFVLWHRGDLSNGLDSFAEPLDQQMPDLQLELATISAQEKPIDSRSAMQKTIESSPLYKAWPDTVARDMAAIKSALESQNFPLFAQTAESNALAMHATMIAASPSICYFLPESIALMHRIWQLRKDGLELYFTMDAGPNLKLLFQKKDRLHIDHLLHHA
jgi:diphosphomevalonate decarboxylase